MTNANNIDEALTADPASDPWADDGEMSEHTGNAGQLISGRKADKHFARAHAVPAALREQRRRRGEPVEQEQPKASNPPRVGTCDPCGRYVNAEGSHMCHDSSG